MNKLFPYDGIKPAAFLKWLQELEQIGVILPFDVNGERYYFIKNFSKHQTINRPSQTRNPAPPASLTEDSLRAHGALTDEREVEEKEKENALHEPCVILFERFYAAYPRHQAKQKALAAWNKIKPVPDEGLLQSMLDAVERQKQLPEWTGDDGRYIPYAATWLNQRRWEDEIPAGEQGTEDPIERAKRRMGL